MSIQHPDGRGSSRGEEVWSKISKGSEDKGDKASNRGQIAVEGACVPSARKGAQAWVPFAYIRAVDVAADGQPVEWRGKVRHETLSESVSCRSVLGVGVKVSTRNPIKCPNSA